MVVEEEHKIFLIRDLRKRILANDEVESCNVKDRSRFQDDDDYLWLFIENNHYDVAEALRIMIDCIKCRQQFGVNDILERNIDRRLFESGILYPRNTDRNGNPLLLFRTKLYDKDYDLGEVKKLFAFALEKMTNEGLAQSITLILDMRDTSLSNMDLELINFFGFCFHKLFPFTLESLIIFETPWIWTAAWTILKSCFKSEGICNLRFVNKQDMLQFVAADQLPVDMGGSDTYIFSYPPHNFSNIQHKRHRGSSPRSDKRKKMRKRNVNKDKLRCKVKEGCRVDDMMIEDRNDEMTKNSTLQLDNTVDVKTVVRHDGNSHRKKKLLPSWGIGDTSIHYGPLVTIIPGNEIAFSASSRSPLKEVAQFMRISNNILRNVAYKIKTTSPHMFRVVPCSGCLPSSGSIDIQILLQPGYHKIVGREKFLVLSTLAPLGENYDSAKIWRSVPKSAVMERRLKCSYQTIYSNDITTVKTIQVKSTNDEIPRLESRFEGCANTLQNVENELVFLRCYLRRMFSLLVMILFTLLCTLIIILAYILDIR